MLLDVQENLIDQSRESLVIDNQIQSFLESNEGQNIKSDIDLLVQMGFDKKMINKVYILLRPENIDRAIDYMTDVDGIYQHDFLASTNPKEKTLCFICKKPKQNHLDYIPDDLLNEDQNIDLINNEDDIIDNDELIIENKDNHGECDVCYDEINEEDKKLNTIPCGHLFCTHCWFNYLKTSIIEAKVDNIRCMDHECNEIISDEFILNHISENNDLIEKYKKFKKRVEIINDANKKICPNPDCESFLEKSELTKYVQCENGHKYCYECLKPPHGDKPCDYQEEKQFLTWTKGKRVKRCPRCKMYTEKNEGCNHMTCASCKYQWCWLCEGKYEYGHYDSGKCYGHQFTKADNLEEANKKVKVKPYHPREPENHCGLHKIFTHVFPPVVRPFESEACYLDYLFILGFWFFSVPVIFIYVVMEYLTSEIILDDDKSEIAVTVIVFGMGVALFACFQAIFIGLITPFMLVSLVYSPFFYKFIFFFGLGDY